MTGDLFVTGTDTGVGKTVLSALLAAALNRRYWKPIQTGASEGTDREAIMRLADLAVERTHAEAFVFDSPVSPHLAAEQRGIRIDIKAVRRPEDEAPIIIEGAGGVLVPINEEDLMIDLIRHLQAPAIIATRTTLGTINHTLLTIAAIRQAGVELAGVVMVGGESPATRQAIEKYGNVPVVGRIPWLGALDRSTLCTAFNQYFDKSLFE